MFNRFAEWQARSLERRAGAWRKHPTGMTVAWALAFTYKVGASRYKTNDEFKAKVDEVIGRVKDVLNLWQKRLSDG